MATVIGRYPPWLVCQSPQGVYYSNEATQETTWQAPPELAAQMAAQSQPPAQAAQAQQAAQYQAMAAQAAQYQAYQQAMAYQQQMAQYQAMAAQAAQQQGAMSATAPAPFAPGPMMSGSAPSAASGGRMKGHLKKWMDEKGFGFIDGGASGQGDVFFHFSGLASEGNKDDLREGVSLEYEMGVDGRTGKSRATNVVIVG